MVVFEQNKKISMSGLFFIARSYFTETNLLPTSFPVKFFVFLKANFMTPSFSAKRVSSSPRLTFFPGWNFVPLCRTITFPIFTFWSPKIFTPKRLDIESLPNCVEPPALRCAIKLIQKSKCKMQNDNVKLKII